MKKRFYPILPILAVLFACAGSQTKTTVVVPPTEGLFTDITPANAATGQALQIKYFKGLWLPIGEGRLEKIDATTQEIKGSGSFGGQSASVYLLVEDRGNNMAHVVFQSEGAVKNDWDLEAGYQKEPGLLTVTHEEALVKQSRYERKCGALGCSGPGIEVYMREKDGREHRIRFDFAP